MPEEQNHDNVTSVDILKEIKDMKDDAKAQHLDSKLFAAYLFSTTVFLAGVGLYMTPKTSTLDLSWQVSYGCYLMVVGAAFGIGFLIYHFRKGKKR